MSRASLQPRRISFYSSAAASQGAATALQNEEPSIAAPVQIYRLHHSHCPQGPIRLRSHAPALSAGCTVIYCALLPVPCAPSEC